MLLFIPNIVGNLAYEFITSHFIFVTAGLVVISSFSVTVEVAYITLPAVHLLPGRGSFEATNRAQTRVTHAACDIMKLE